MAPTLTYAESESVHARLHARGSSSERTTTSATSARETDAPADSGASSCESWRRREPPGRSSSRVGFLDLQVNAKRLNWISNQLRAKGWTAEAITEADYPDYFGILFFTNDDYIRSVLSPQTCPIPEEPLNCKDPK